MSGVLGANIPRSAQLGCPCLLCTSVDRASIARFLKIRQTGLHPHSACSRGSSPCSSHPAHATLDVRAAVTLAHQILTRVDISSACAHSTPRNEERRCCAVAIASRTILRPVEGLHACTAVQHKLMIIQLARAGWQVLHSVAVGSLVQQWHAVRLSASLAHS
jgi:hypothetical protein